MTILFVQGAEMKIFFHGTLLMDIALNVVVNWKTLVFTV